MRERKEIVLKEVKKVGKIWNSVNHLTKKVEIEKICKKKSHVNQETKTLNEAFLEGYAKVTAVMRRERKKSENW